MTQTPDHGLITDALWRHERDRPERQATVLGDDRRTYHQLAAQVRELASLLLDLGVQRGDRVALLSTPRPEFLISFLATAHVGGVWVGLNPRATLRELAYVLEDARPRIVFGFPELIGQDQREQLLAAVPDATAATLSLGEGFGRFTPLATALDEHAVDVSAVGRRATAVASGDPALLVYTSGTTGAPKGAPLSHRGLLRCATTQLRYWPVDPLRLVNNLPINHVGCVGDLGCYALLAGGTQVFMERFDPGALLQTIERESITFWGQVPTMFAFAMDHPEVARTDLSSLQRIAWSGAAMPRDLVARLAELPVALSTSYGMTETTGSVTVTDPGADVDTLAGTVGRPAAGYEVRIADEEGRRVPGGEPGELQVRGDWLMLGYLDRPEATAEVFDDEGWLRTGDLARRRDDGNLVLVGRSRERFKSGGLNVYPREVEQVLESHPQVAIAVVVSVPDELYGEVGAAAVLPTAGARLDVASLVSHARDALANYKIPKRFDVVDDLPMLEVGKVDRSALQARYSGQPA